jgi:hypothetical protein
MSQKVLGDGCSVCNPTLRREVQAYNEGVADERARCAEVARSEPLHHADGWTIAKAIEEGEDEVITNCNATACRL